MINNQHKKHSKIMMLAISFGAILAAVSPQSLAHAEELEPYLTDYTRVGMTNAHFASGNWNMHCRRVTSGKSEGKANCALEPWDGIVLWHTSIRRAADSTTKIVVDETQEVSIYLNDGKLQYAQPFSFTCANFELSGTRGISSRRAATFKGKDAASLIEQMVQHEECIIRFTPERSAAVVTIEAQTEGLMPALKHAREWVQ